MEKSLRRKWTPFLFVAVAWLLSGTAVAQSARPQRDWQKHPAIVEFETKEDIYALGDVHGDYDRLVDLLVAGNILAGRPTSPQQAEWRAGKAVLVCTGDFIDKGDHSLDVIALLRVLGVQSAKAGGKVIVTMGNHEACFLTDPRNVKAKEFVKELDLRKLDPSSLSEAKDGEGIGRFLHSLPLGARVNDWFFAHAGHTRGRSIKQLEVELREGIDARGYDISLVPAIDGLLESRMNPHVWWHTPGESAGQSKDRLAGYVKALGVKHLVVGHQPGKITFPDKVVRRKGEMFQHYDGLIFLIDVGMSRALNEGAGNSSGALLHIKTGPSTATAIFPKGAAKQLWPN